MGRAGLSLGVPELQGHPPFATQAPTERTDVVIYLCSSASVNATLEPGQGPRCDAPATDEQISQLRAALALDEAVAEVQLETQQQAYERFAELFADRPSSTHPLQQPARDRDSGQVGHQPAARMAPQRRCETGRTGALKTSGDRRADGA